MSVQSGAESTPPVPEYPIPRFRSQSQQPHSNPGNPEHCAACRYRRQHGWNRGDPFHCKDCHYDWTGVEAQHCVTCHRTFTSQRSADAHLDRQGRCVTPVAGVSVRKLGYWRESRPGVWALTHDRGDVTTFTRPS